MQYSLKTHHEIDDRGGGLPRKEDTDESRGIKLGNYATDGELVSEEERSRISERSKIVE